MTHFWKVNSPGSSQACVADVFLANCTFLLIWRHMRELRERAGERAAVSAAPHIFIFSSCVFFFLVLFLCVSLLLPLLLPRRFSPCGHPQTGTP